MVARWRYVPPSALTCTSLLVGLVSISEAMSGQFVSSAWLIMLCGLLDKLDGTAARLLHSSSRFGMELDSLADMLCFGVGPAALVYSVLVGEHAGDILARIPTFKYLVFVGCALYVVSAALRLAKFNVVTELYGGMHFFGFPTTTSGTFISVYYLTGVKYDLSPVFVQALPFILIFYALMMISRVPLRKLGIRKSLPFNIFLFTNMVGIYTCGLFRLFPEYLLVIGSIYLFVGATWATIAGVHPPALVEQEEGTEEA